MANEELTTVARIKAELGITDSSQDTVIGYMLDSAEGAIATWLGRRKNANGLYWTSGMVTETISGYNWHKWILRNFPVTSIASVSRFVSSTTSTDLSSSFYRIDDDMQTLRFSRNWADLWLIGEPRRYGSANVPYDGPIPDAYPYIKVVYTGGFDDMTSGPVPAALQAAATEVAKYLFMNKDTNWGLNSETLGKYSYTIGSGASSGGGGGGGGMSESFVNHIKSMYLSQWLPPVL